MDRSVKYSPTAGKDHIRPMGHHTLSKAGVQWGIGNPPCSVTVNGHTITCSCPKFKSALICEHSVVWQSMKHALKNSWSLLEKGRNYLTLITLLQLIFRQQRGKSRQPRREKAKQIKSDRPWWPSKNGPAHHIHPHRPVQPPVQSPLHLFHLSVLLRLFCFHWQHHHHQQQQQSNSALKTSQHSGKNVLWLRECHKSTTSNSGSSPRLLLGKQGVQVLPRHWWH